MSNLTVQKAQQQLAALGLVIKNYDGDYCVNYRHGSSSTAYYSASLEETFAYGVKMAQRNEKALGRWVKAFEQLRVQS